MALKTGDKAPEVLGVNQDGKEIRLSDFAGKKLVLYFIPKIIRRVVRLPGLQFARRLRRFA